MYTLPPFMDAVLSEERQLMKWVGIFQGGSLMGGNCPGGNFPRTLIYKLFFRKHLPRSVL